MSQKHFQPCPVCGFLFVERHHIIPYAWGGQDVPENWVFLCPNHHKLAHIFLKYQLTRERVEKSDGLREWMKEETAFLAFYEAKIEPIIDAFMLLHDDSVLLRRFGRAIMRS